MNFKVDKKKGRFLIIVLICWIILLNLISIILNRVIQCDCFNTQPCVDFPYLVPLIPVCICCVYLSYILIGWIIILIPVILTYLVWSLFQNKEIGGKNK